MEDVKVRFRLSAPIKHYVRGLSDVDAWVVTDVARLSPASIHPLCGTLPHCELLTMAAIALAEGTTTLNDYISYLPLPPGY
jgi:hypothetical protein